MCVRIVTPTVATNGVPLIRQSLVPLGVTVSVITVPRQHIVKIKTVIVVESRTKQVYIAGTLWLINSPEWQELMLVVLQTMSV